MTEIQTDETLESLTAEGRRLLKIFLAPHTITDADFYHWNNAVAKWLTEQFPQSGRSAAWSALPFEFNQLAISPDDGGETLRQTVRAHLEFLSKMGG